MSTFKKVDIMMQLNKLTNIKQISEKGKLENAKTWNRTLLLEILVFLSRALEKIVNKSDLFL